MRRTELEYWILDAGYSMLVEDPDLSGDTGYWMVGILTSET